MMGVRADEPFRNARWDSFHCLKPANSDIVFVGNSITNMHQWWEALGGQNNVLNRGTSGGFTTEVLPNLEAITAGHPKKVFIGIGTNDICTVANLETTADNVRIIAERIARECPETEVYIQSLIPSTNDGNHVEGGGRNGRVRQVNELYKAKAEALAAKGLNVKFLDVNTPLASSSNPNALKTSASGQSIAFDNLHPNAVGYKYWLDTIKEETGFECIYEDKQMVGGMGNSNAFGDCLTSFEQFPIKSTDILMVGGDAIHNGEWHEFMKSGDFKNRGLGWGKFSIAIDQFYTIVERSLAASGSVAPKAIVLYADKDSNNSTAASTQLNSLKTAINQIKAKAPGSEIFVISTLPNTAAAKNNIVTEFNSLLASNAASVGYTYVDAYSAINANRQLYMNNTDYVYTRGYAKIAQVLATALNTKLGTNYKPISDEEASANVTNFEARTELGNAITNALRLANDKYIGEAIGQYTASSFAELNTTIEASCNLLSGNPTVDQLAAQTTSLTAVVPAINLPTAENVTGKVFQISTPNRSNLYLVNNGAGQLVTGDATANTTQYANSRWTMTTAANGTFNIKSASDNTYLDPSSITSSDLKTTATAPATGWVISASAAPGTFVIKTTDGKFLNMRNNGTGICNWAQGGTTDTGNQFAITDVTALEEQEVPSPETIEGDKYYIRTQFNSSTNLYLYNNNGSVATTSTKPTGDNGVWAITDNQIRNLADGKYLGVNSGFKLYAESHTLTLGEGTTSTTMSIAESNRYGAVNSNGTVDKGQFTGTKYAESGGWTTNFVFEAVEGETTDPTDGYIVDKNNGSLYRDGAVSTGWSSVWKSTDGLLTFISNANNMQWNGNNIDARSGSAKSATYTLTTTNSEYVIESYSFKAKALTANAQTWKQGSNTYNVTNSGETTIAGNDVDEQNVSFILTGENQGTLLTEFHVTLKKVEVDPTLVEPEKVTVLDNAHSSIPYRIPAIASTKDGVLVVAADYRFTKADIGGGRLDLHIRRSFDYGKTWEDKIIMPENMVGDGNCSNHNDYAGFGDPCIVADRESNKIMILSCAGYPGFFSCTRDQHQRCARWYSEDNGETWTGPDFIDNTFVFEPLDGTSFGPAQGMFFGSGKIHQSRYVKVKDYYRLYASNSVRNGSGTIRNYVMYSDDFGMTWDFLGGVDGPAVPSGGDEPKVEELPNGNVVFSGRVNGGGGRNFNIFKFTDLNKAEGAWQTVSRSNGSVNGITNDNACNGEIQLVPVVRKKDNEKMWLALQSVPFNGRNNVGIFYKPLATEDDYATPAAVASNWENKHQSSWTSSAYSTMVLQGDKNIGFVYEENGYNGGYDIQYKNYSIEVLTNGKYAFDPDYEMADVVLPLQAAIVTPAAGTVEQIEEITVKFNKPLTLKQTNVTLAEDVTATASVEDNVLTLTLASAITEGGKYELTIPAGVVADDDEQENAAISLTYRILGEEKELGAEVTALADIDAHKTYALYNPASHGYAIFAPQYSTTAMWAGEMQDMDANHKVVNPSYSEDVNHADPNNAWMIVTYKDNTYLYNVGAQKFVTVARPTTLTTTANPITVEKISDGFAFITTAGAQNYMCASPQLGEPVAVWTNSDPGSCWKLYENPNVEAEYEACIKLIDPIVVGIETLDVFQSTSTVYDIQGRRLQAIPSRRGLYIVGGRKVVK